MAISFCRVDLLLEDADGKLAEWMDRFQPPDDTRWFGAVPVSLNNNRPQSRSGQRAFVGLPIPNYSEPLKPKLNTLYWPTGATRWAFGLFLATRAQLNEILATLDVTENLPGTLILYDEEHSTSVNTEMYLLPPHPISTDTGTGTEDDDRLWILPLVDERYFWQFKSVGSLGNMPSTWADLIALMGTALGATISAADVPTEYGIPDPVELRRDYENLPLYLDALAHSVGMRVTRLPAGDVRIESPSESHTRYSSNIDEKVWEQVTGDNFSSIYPPSAFPEKVTVVFPKYRSHTAFAEGDVFAFDVEAADAGADSSFGLTIDTVKLIHSTAYADFTDAGADPDNLTDLTDLATQIAGDFYKWLRRRYDMTYAGIVEWTPTGYCDWIEWAVGHRARTPSGPHLHWHTRVRSQPVNFGSEEQCSQFVGLTVPATTAAALIRTRLNIGETLADGGTAQCTIQTTSDSGATWVDGDVITVREWIGLDEDVTNRGQKNRIIITGAPTGGDFTITVAGQTTTAIARNASAATVVSAVEALSSVGSGNVTGSGGSLPNVPVDLLFGGDLDATTLSISVTGSLTGGTSPAVSVSTVQTALRRVIIVSDQGGWYGAVVGRCLR